MIGSTLFALLLTAQAGQTPPPDALPTVSVHANISGQFNRIQQSLQRAAEAMPAEHYGFRPAEGMRTFAEAMLHAVRTNYGMCANLTGQPHNVDLKAIEARTSKAAITRALAESIAFCDGFVARISAESFMSAYDSTMVRPDGSRSGLKVQRGGLLANLVAHQNEMYGYLAVYLRLKGIVPPTSQPRAKQRGPQMS